jgi:ribulose-5-phosphate 4-epimerase/fuculose-1-phosphate aldolase
VAYHDFEGITVDEGEQARLVASIGDKQTVILRNHGLLAWGASVPEAFMWLWTLQRACDVQAASAAMGEMNPVSTAALEQAVRESGPGEGAVCDLVFAALMRQIDARDRSYRD